MAQPQHTPSFVHLEEALSVLFCLIDDAYAALNPHGARRYESIKRLSDAEVIALALFQQLRGVESERSFLRDAQRFFSHLFGSFGRLGCRLRDVRGHCYWGARLLCGRHPGRSLGQDQDDCCDDGCLRQLRRAHRVAVWLAHVAGAPREPGVRVCHRGGLRPVLHNGY